MSTVVVKSDTSRVKLRVEVAGSNLGFSAMVLSMRIRTSRTGSSSPSARGVSTMVRPCCTSSSSSK